MSPFIVLALSTPLLVLNYKWALVDPHDPGDGPSWRAAILNALWVSALLASALAAQQGGFPQLSVFVSSFAFGTAISPSIAPPYNVPRAEEPRWLRRFFKSRLHGLRIISVKILLLLPVAWLIQPFVAEHRSFYASGLIAVLFSVLKAFYLRDLLREPAHRASYAAGRHRLLAGTVPWTCLVGSAGLVLWLACVYPVADAFPEPQLDDYATVAAFAFGLLLRPS